MSTVSPGDAVFPPVGFCACTMPSWLCCDVAWQMTTGLRLALCSVDTACAWVSPMTSGTVTDEGPVDTTRLTDAWLGACEPAGGLVLTTSPLGMLFEAWLVIVPQEKPAWPRTLHAVAVDSPATSGIVVVWGGGWAVTRFTVLPGGTDCPPFGFWSHTMFCWVQVALNWVFSLRPKDCSWLVAAVTDWLMSDGTFTGAA